MPALVAVLLCCHAMASRAGTLEAPAVYKNVHVDRGINANSLALSETFEIEALCLEETCGDYFFEHHLLNVTDQAFPTSGRIDVVYAGGGCTTPHGIGGRTSFNKETGAIAVTCKQGDKLILTVRVLYKDGMTARQISVRQDQDPHFTVTLNVALYSRYETEKMQATNVEFMALEKDVSTDVRAMQGFSANGNMALYTYNINGDMVVPPFTVIPAQVAGRVSFNLIVTKQDVDVEIAHWSETVSIEERVHVLNPGPPLNDGFSRSLYTKQRNKAPSGRRSLAKKGLPSSAHDLYFVDFIGNISSSRVVARDESLAVKLDLRYPLFGGWKNDFRFGYVLPLGEYVFVDEGDSEQYLIDLPLNSVYERTLTVDQTINVILPEGAYDVNILDPSVETLTVWNKPTYVDVEGRVVYTFNVGAKDDSVPDHLVVTYRMARSSLLREPLILSAGIFIILLIVTLVQRANCSVVAAESGADGSSLGEETSDDDDQGNEADTRDTAGKAKIE